MHFLVPQNNSCLCFGVVWAASASEGACHSQMRNAASRKQLNSAWHYPGRRQKIWLTCWKLKHVSQFPRCLSLKNDPSFTFLSGQRGIVSIRKKTDLCEIASLTALELKITAEAFKISGAQWYFSAVVTAHVSDSFESSYREHDQIKTPCHSLKL